MPRTAHTKTETLEYAFTWARGQTCSDGIFRGDPLAQKKVAALKSDSKPDKTGKTIFSKVHSILKMNKIAEEAVGLG